MTTMMTLVNPEAKTFWTIRYNVDSKRVKTVGGRLGTKGVATRRVFDGYGREVIRAYVDSRIETKAAKGFVRTDNSL